MAPLKRVRTSLDPAESESDDSADARSSTDSNKRRRTSASLSLSENGNGTDDGQPGEGESEDEEALLLQATQAVQEKYSFYSDEPNAPADHGIIERVDCYNFMCHEHFSVELGPLINFIVGKNGSGKSAILTAITLCLGGKASATNRGQSLKSFIKEGNESATIIVRIKNQGDGAYMPDDYGKSIIVERIFSRNGTSGFKIKNETGRIVSTKKLELDAITDFFNLQIDNPMNVLSQDMARQFLSSSSPAEKYKFFVKGVQLEQLDHDYRLIEESVDQIDQKLKTRADDIKVLSDDLERAKRRLELSDQQASLRDRVRNLRGQMAWAQVEEQERIRDSLDDEIVKSDERIFTAESEIGVLDDYFQRAERESEIANQVLTGALADLERVMDEKKEIQSRHEDEMQEHHEMLAQQRQIREYLVAAESRIARTEEDIAQETQRLADINGGNYARKQDEIDQRRSEVSQTRHDYDEHVQDAHRLRESLRAAEEEVKRNVAPLSKQKSDIEETENLLKTLLRDRGQTDAGFHERMPMLLRAIRQDSSFSRSPVGPIGRHVTLLEPKWSSILEASLNTTLSSFIVTSKRDMNVLSDIMQRVNCVCPIFIGSEGRIDTSEHEPNSQFATVLRVLEIDNDLVRRQLIINHGIEQMLLIENLEEATETLFEGPRLRNVKRCFCIDQADKRRGIHLSYGRTGEPSQSPIGQHTGRPRMRTDVDSQIRLLQDTIQELKKGLRDMERRLTASRTHLQRCKEALVTHKSQEDELQINLQRLDDQVEELTDALERDTVQDGRLDVLKAALQDAEGEKRVSQGSFDESVAAMSAIKERLKATRREMISKDTEIEAQNEQVNIAESESSKVKEQRRLALAEKNTAVTRVDDLRQARSRIVIKRDEVAARILDYSEQASIVSPRVAVDEGETPNSLDHKLERLQKDLDRFNNQMGATREEIAAELYKAQTAFDLANKQIDELAKLEEIFKRTLAYRRDRWKHFRSHISSRAKAQFTYLLSERSFRGRLLTNHESKLLELRVEPDITKKSMGRNAKTLSGGEKSFSQVCLLLSLWEAMGSPIRCLDEFDVYMDSVNRKMAIDMLMLAARRSIGRQFILITPGSRAEINLAPDVRVKELAEPERGQRTISFRPS